MKKISTLFVALISCVLLVSAEDTSFINEQIIQINKVIADNSKGENDPQANFVVDNTNKVLTLNFFRNQSLAGMQKDVFENMAKVLPNTLFQTVYLKTKSILDGRALASKLIKELQDGNYTINVNIEGTDDKFEFSYPNSILSL